jgi:hypothetical protein
MKKTIGILGSLGVAFLGICDVKGEPQLLRLKNSVDWGVNHIQRIVEDFTGRIQRNVARLEKIGRLSPSPWTKAKTELIERYPFLVNLDPDTFPELFFQEEFFVGTERKWWQWEWRCLRHNINSMRHITKHILEVTDALEELVNTTETSLQKNETPTTKPWLKVPQRDAALLDVLARSRLLPSWFPRDEGALPRENFKEDMKSIKAQIEQKEKQLRKILGQYLPDEDAISQCMATMNDISLMYSLELDVK